ncbi:kinesin-like protein KIN-5D [Sesamum indicum]|uniref:Kinesin-like protein n=1 Tax=Sesamum indicum TaxID=4182 RepID=A0A8M8UR61_SESIN|nr:kinesin-like protein KIN-5D [Sesamum indicum]
MDSSKKNQQKRRSLTPSSMPRTLWSIESPTRDLQLSNDHKAVNVQVVLRCRPLNEDEIKARTHLVVSCDELKREVTATQYMAYKQTDRTLVFDKVFGPASQQQELYDNVVAPVVNEVLEGYSWTIFAYGQTGTGKTYTMEGEGRKEKNGKLHENAGVIPRAVQQIFDVLESERADYSIKVTFLELYNEEITDLLAVDKGLNSLYDEPKRSLLLMEDGKGAIFVRGLEEEIVSTADEIYAILDRGSAKKHTAETLLNKQSNRSHSIFSITIQSKQYNSDGSELIKCGKLNLVDLAGSENILRSGARDERAREAGEINKSLLTLGRVINALTENSVHVPYRHSKLTRLLRDSLGGKTKTCIIATVSPSVLSQEETLSTLDYAFRAKSIKNRPEVNRKVVKSTLIKDLYSQIDRLKQELHAAREKNGVYVPQDKEHSQEATRKQLMELQELYMYQQQLTVDLKDKLESTQRELMKTRESLFNLEGQYRQAKDKDKEAMIFNILCSGKALTERALELRSDLESAASDVSTLFARIERKNDLEERNRYHIQKFHSQLAHQLEELDKVVSASATRQEQNWEAIQENARSLLTSKAAAMEELLKQIQDLKDLYTSSFKRLDDSAEELYQNSELAFSRLRSELSAHSSCIMDLIMKSSSDADTISNGLKINLNNLGSRIESFIQQQHENHMRTYQTSKSISESLLSFFKTLRIYISKLTLMEEDSQTITSQKLRALTKTFEEFAVGEQRLLAEQIAELLTSSSSRKKKLIQTAVDDILESARERTEKLNQEISDVQNITADAEEKWTNYVETTEGNYGENSAAIEAGKGNLAKGLQLCITKSSEVAEQRRVAEESLLDLLQENVDAVISFIENGTEENEKIHARFSSIAPSVFEETDEVRKKLVLSVEYPVRLDHESLDKINVLSACCLDNMKETNNIHSEKVMEISRTARKSLVDDYLVEGSSCLSPKKRNYNLPSKECVEDFINRSFRDPLQASSRPDAIAE